jgi:hypothetical protein
MAGFTRSFGRESRLARVVYDGLGHDARSYESAGHVRLLRLHKLVALPDEGAEIELAWHAHVSGSRDLSQISRQFRPGFDARQVPQVLSNVAGMAQEAADSAGKRDARRPPEWR